MFRMSAKELEEKRPVYRDIKSPAGPLRLVATGLGLRGLLFERTLIRSEGVFKGLGKDPGHPVLTKAEQELDEYFSGKRRTFDVALDLEGTPFQREVWKILRQIPYGETVSYGDIAARVGHRNKARPVGGAVGANPVGIIVPCHRVVGGDGSLTGFGGGLGVKSFLLHLEATGTGNPASPSGTRRPRGVI
jgi:methylated-DNA-[protein]-cysteine S-methyltransferase